MTCLLVESGMDNFNCIKNEVILIPKDEPRIRSPFRERAKFYEAKKLRSETVTEYYAKLLNLSISCEFNENFDDRVLCDKFITGFASGFIFEHLCNQDKEITFSEALNLALKYETDLQCETTFDRTTNSTINKFNVSEEEVSLYFMEKTILKAHTFMFSFSIEPGNKSRPTRFRRFGSR